MSPFALSCLWCVLQITLLCAVGVALSMLIVRRYPASSAAVMSTTAGMVLIATALIPIQIPHWALPQVSVTEASKTPQLLPSPEAGEASTNKNGPKAAFIDLYTLLAKVRTATRLDATKGSSPSFVIWCVTAIVTFGICVGTLRFCVAFFSVWRIRRGSVPLDSNRAKRQIKVLACSMRCRVPVCLATSTEVRSAVVIGWLHPFVVLPADWKAWSSEQLRAVLAHELAHVVRRDFLWRLLGTIARAVHYYHPLAHWLLGRLAYSQEVAADQLAAKAFGSRKQYLKALSQLAIRQDDLLRLRAEPIFLPTSSSYLIRRMKMLRTKERTQSRGMNLTVRVITVSAVVLLAVMTTALRGLAEPAGDPPITPPTPTEGVQNSIEAMFQYPPLDPAIIGDNEDGIFVLRVGELLKRDAIKPRMGAINQMASTTCQALFSSPELPDFDLEMIDYVVGQTEFKVKRLERTPEMPHNSQMTFGSKYWVVRFHRDISSWQQWVRKYVPAAEELQHGEITYFQLPAIPAFGSTGFRVAARDSHTLVFALDEGESFWEQIEAANTVNARWADQWKQLEGGLFSFLATDKSIEISLDEPNSPSAMAMNQVFDNIQQIGYSADWDDRTGQMGVKMLFSCSSRKEAELVETGINSALSLGHADAKAELENDKEADPTRKAERVRFLLDLLNNSEMRTTLQPDGTVIVHLEISFTHPLQKLVQEFLPEAVASREPISSKTK